MRQELTFNGKALSDFGVWFDGSVSFGSPERDVELVEVVGRNGALSISNDRFRNIEITFPCAIRTNFIDNYRNLMAFLNSSKGYCRLETTQEPNYYRLALFMNQTDPTGYKLNTHGRFDLVFQVMPQRFLKSGENWTTVSSSSSEISGNPVSISNPSGLTTLTGLNVDIEPIQNLNGYDHPWVGGAGKNKLPMTVEGIKAANTGGTWSGNSYTYRGLTFNILTNDGNNVTGIAVSGTSTGSNYFHLCSQRQWQKGQIITGCPSGGGNASYGLGITETGSWDYGSSRVIAGDFNKTCSIWYAENIVASHTWFPMIREATETDATFEPYSNTSPITGHTSATVTRTVDGSATDYTIDLNGTRYGGTVDLATGVLTVTHMVYAPNNADQFTDGDGNVYMPNYRIGIGRSSDAKSSHFRYVNSTTGLNGVFSVSDSYFAIRASGIADTKAIFTEYLTQQANLGTPVQFILALQNPTTVQLTAQQVSLLTGTNIIGTDMNSLTVTISSPAELENPTLFESKPIIRVWGNGTLNVNDQYITVANSPYAYIDIDCELMDCYHGSSNANQYVSFSTTDYVTLRNGMNYFSYSGFTKVEVTPRWYEI